MVLTNEQESELTRLARSRRTSDILGDAAQGDVFSSGQSRM